MYPMEEAQKAHKTLSALESGDPRRGKRASTWTRLRRSPGAMIGLMLIVLLLLVALTADSIASQGIDDQDLRKGLFPPSRDFPLGTDEFGRDMLSRIIHGSRISLQVAIVTAAISAVIGVALGSIAGYVGGSTLLVCLKKHDRNSVQVAIAAYLVTNFEYIYSWQIVAEYQQVRQLRPQMSKHGQSRPARYDLHIERSQRTGNLLPDSGILMNNQ